MSHTVESATPLEDVAVDGGQVWLRRGVSKEERTREFDTGEGEPSTYTVYSAEEVTFTDPTVTAEYAREHFDALWDAAEALALSPREYADRLSSANADAIADLSGAVSDNATSVSDLSDAIADLSQTVSDMQAGKEA